MTCAFLLSILHLIFDLILAALEHSMSDAIVAIVHYLIRMFAG
jgi:hypothetical protein